MLAAFLARRRAFRARVEREATDLLTFMGGRAYVEARQRMREHRTRGDRKGCWLWAKVAVEIAERTGQEIGVKGADRWPDPGPRPASDDPKRRAIVDALVDASRGIAALSSGRGDAATLHNIGAHLRQAVALAGATSAMVLAADDVVAACEEIAIRQSETIAALHAGVYPPAVEGAGQALLRLRLMVLSQGS